MRVPLALALMLVAGPTAATQLSGEQMRAVLTGNSIVHPDFGCVFYGADGSMRLVSLAGEVATGTWEVRGDLYYSSGQCGTSGCSLDGEYPRFTFRRTDGGYEQAVVLIRGNYCDKDGIVS